MWIRIASTFVPFLGCVACLPDVHSRTAEPKMHETTAGEVFGPYVPRGTIFTIELLDPLSSTGGLFRGRLRDELRAPDGFVVVRRGALIEGHVVPSALGDDDVRVELIAVQTMSGDVPISVADVGRERERGNASPRVLTTSAAQRGAELRLVLTEPFVPAGSTYR